MGVEQWSRVAYLFRASLAAALGYGALARPQVIKGGVRSTDEAVRFLFETVHCTLYAIWEATQDRPCIVDATRVKANDVEVLQ